MCRSIKVNSNLIRRFLSSWSSGCLDGAHLVQLSDQVEGKKVAHDLLLLGMLLSMDGYTHGGREGREKGGGEGGGKGGREINREREREYM